MNKLSFDFEAQSCFNIEQVADFINSSSNNLTAEFLAAAYAADCCESCLIQEAEAHLEFLAAAGAEFDITKALALLK